MACTIKSAIAELPNYIVARIIHKELVVSTIGVFSPPHNVSALGLPYEPSLRRGYLHAQALPPYAGACRPMKMPHKLFAGLYVQRPPCGGAHR